MKSVQSFPFDKSKSWQQTNLSFAIVQHHDNDMVRFILSSDYVAEPTCACCFLQCYPLSSVGCCNDAPECPAEENLRLVGGGVITTHSLARDMIRSHKMSR